MSGKVDFMEITVLPSFIVDGICTNNGEEMCNLGYACDACPFNALEIIDEKYIRFMLIEWKKTKLYSIVTRSGHVLLGQIKWFGRWRQYCFFPVKDAVFSRGCMTDIGDFIWHLMNERKVNSPKDLELVRQLAEQKRKAKIELGKTKGADL